MLPDLSLHPGERVLSILKILLQFILAAGNPHETRFLADLQTRGTSDRVIERLRKGIRH